MITRRMNTRITIFEKTGGQNEDGEVVAAIRKDVLSCWAEVQKNSIRDFKESSKKQDSADGLAKSKDVKIFLIRYLPKAPFDNSMYVDFYGLEYKITNIEVDYSKKDMIMISAARTS